MPDFHCLLGNDGAAVALGADEVNRCTGHLDTVA
jgi:hypothetical protein